jgi:hypothetical protein
VPAPAAAGGRKRLRETAAARTRGKAVHGPEKR